LATIPKDPSPYPLGFFVAATPVLVRFSALAS